MEENYIPVGVVWRLERNKRLAVPARDYSTATDPEVKARAMRALATEYAFVNAKGEDDVCGLTPEESVGMLGILSGGRYEERARADLQAEAKARNEQAASIFAAEETLWKR